MSKKERQAYRKGIIDAVLYGTMLITGILMTSVYFYTKLFIFIRVAFVAQRIWSAHSYIPETT